MPHKARWTWLMSAFLERLESGSLQEVPSDHALAFEHDGLVLRMTSHPERPWLMLSVDILALDPLFDEQINHERLHTLHQLNALGYFDHRAVAVVTPSDLLVLCAHLDLRALEPEELVDQLNVMIARAKQLRDSWVHLGDLLRQDSTKTLSPTNASTPAFV